MWLPPFAVQGTTDQGHESLGHGDGEENQLFPKSEQHFTLFQPSSDAPPRAARL